MTADAAVYDPLRAGLPRRPLEHVNSYWHATAGPAPADDGPLNGDIATDIAIIGAGYTGLSCAYTLAHQFGLRAVVLEANHPAWGCSGRNGGFARIALGRLPISRWVGDWGSATAREMFCEAREALETVRELIATANIECDRAPDGYLKIAHSRAHISTLEREQRLLLDVCEYRTELVSAAALRSDYFRGEEAFAALRYADGFAVHPMKFAYGLLRMAREAGAIVHSRSPVAQWTRAAGQHVLHTPQGTVRARRVVIATNGYSTECLHPALKARLIPVLSNIVVTRPLTDSERRESNMITSDIMSDTRTVLNYYRRLADGRMLLGSRGPIHESASNVRRDKLLETLHRKFPALREVTADYCWGGWVALTMDQLPHVHTVEEEPTVSYAIGYNGSGVSAATYAGRRLAQSLAHGAPVYRKIATPLPRVPFPSFRRLGQAIAFGWFRLKDRFGE